jgi:hypothetical protein
MADEVAEAEALATGSALLVKTVVVQTAVTDGPYSVKVTVPPTAPNPPPIAALSVAVLPTVIGVVAEAVIVVKACLTVSGSQGLVTPALFASPL